MVAEARGAVEAGSPALDLIDLVYGAASDPSRWGAFIEALSQTCGGAAVAISLQIPTGGMPVAGARVGLLDEYAPLFTKHAQRGLPWGSLVMPLYTRQFAFGSDVLPNEKVAATAYYQEYMQPQGLAPEGPLAHIFAELGGRAIAAIVLYRRVDTRPLDWRDLERCNELVPHLARAYRIHCKLHGERERLRAMAEVVDRFPMGVLLLDEQGCCEVANLAAERVLRMNDGISRVDGRPTARDPGENAKLRDAIDAAAREARTGIPGETHLVSISRPSGAAPFGARVTPLMDFPSLTHHSDVLSVIFLSNPDAAELGTQVLQDLYAFTPAEAGLVCQLVAGQSVEEAAKLCGIQTSTARGYLKSAYQKTDTHGQRDLIRLILTGVSPLREP